MDHLQLPQVNQLDQSIATQGSASARFHYHANKLSTWNSYEILAD